MLTLRCAQGLRPSGDRGPDDYDVMDADRVIGRVFLQPHGAWFWTLNFMTTGRMTYGSALTREEAMVAFKAEYDRWLNEAAG